MDYATYHPPFRGTRNNHWTGKALFLGGSLGGSSQEVVNRPMVNMSPKDRLWDPFQMAVHSMAFQKAFPWKLLKRICWSSRLKFLWRDFVCTAVKQRQAIPSLKVASKVNAVSVSVILICGSSGIDLGNSRCFIKICTVHCTHRIHEHLLQNMTYIKSTKCR